MYATGRRLPSTAEEKSLRVADSFFYFQYDSCFLDKGVEANERRAKRGKDGKDAVVRHCDRPAGSVQDVRDRKATPFYRLDNMLCQPVCNDEDLTTSR